MSFMAVRSFPNLLAAISAQTSESVFSALFLALMVVCMAGAVSVEFKKLRREHFALSSLTAMRFLYIAGAVVFGFAFMASTPEFTTVMTVNETFVGDVSSQEYAQSNVAYVPNAGEVRITPAAFTTPGRLPESRAYGPDSPAAPQALFVAPSNVDSATSAKAATSLSEEIAPAPLSSANDVQNAARNKQPYEPSRGAVSRAYGSDVETAVSNDVAADVATSPERSVSDVVKAFQPERTLLPTCFSGNNPVNPISPTGFASSRSAAPGASPIGVSELNGSESDAAADYYLLSRLDEEKAKVSREVRAAVLTLNVKKIVAGKTEEVHGSGFAVQYNDRIFVITNNHVVEDADNCSAISISTYDGQSFSPSRIMLCDDFDIAALEIDLQTVANLSSLRLCRLADSTELEAGFGVFTIGAPLFMDWTMTYGHVGRVYRDVAELKEARIIKESPENVDKDLVRFIQISGIILEGNSGGPLFNARGEVVGIVTASIQQDACSTGIGFALPIEDALSVVRNMADSGGSWRRSYLGVVLDGSRSGEYVIEHGVGLSEVKQNSPAELAGVKAGDHIRSFNGKRVTNKYDLARMIALSKPGETGRMEILRDGRPIAISFSTCSGAGSTDVKSLGSTIRR